MLHVWTSTIAYPGPSRLDITVKSATGIGTLFTPTWDMVKKHKAHKITDKQYELEYKRMMEVQLNRAFSPFQTLLYWDQVVLCCYCRYKVGAFCHRFLLADYLVQRGAVYENEIVDFSPWKGKPTAPITAFQGDYSWLSNFAPCEFVHKGQLYKSVENFYQAHKVTKDATIKVPHPTAAGQTVTTNAREYLAICASPKRAVKMYKIKPPAGWHDGYGDIVMRTGLEYKFVHNRGFKRLLANTGTVKVTEGNYWHDNYWGDCKCHNCEGIVGRNKLGKMIMEIREANACMPE